MALTGRTLAPVLAKVDEELDELKSAIAEKNAIDAREHVAEELGDLLFVMANVARHLGVDPEAALRTANAKVVRRFEAIEGGRLRPKGGIRKTRRSRRWTRYGTRRSPMKKGRTRKTVRAAPLLCRAIEPGGAEPRAPACRASPARRECVTR